MVSETAASWNKLSSMLAQQRRAARRLRWLAAGMAVMFLLAMIAVGVAFKLRNDAVTERTMRAGHKEYAEGQSRIAKEEKQKAEKQFERAEGERKSTRRNSKEPKVKEESTGRIRKSRGREEAGVDRSRPRQYSGRHCR